MPTRSLSSELFEKRESGERRESASSGWTDRERSKHAAVAVVLQTCDESEKQLRADSTGPEDLKERLTSFSLIFVKESMVDIDVRGVVLRPADIGAHLN